MLNCHKDILFPHSLARVSECQSAGSLYPFYLPQIEINVPWPGISSRSPVTRGINLSGSVRIKYIVCIKKKVYMLIQFTYILCSFVSLYNLRRCQKCIQCLELWHLMSFSPIQLRFPMHYFKIFLRREAYSIKFPGKHYCKLNGWLGAEIVRGCSQWTF